MLRSVNIIFVCLFWTVLICFFIKIYYLNVDVFTNNIASVYQLFLVFFNANFSFLFQSLNCHFRHYLVRYLNWNNSLEYIYNKQLFFLAPTSRTTADATTTTTTIATVSRPLYGMVVVVLFVCFIMFIEIISISSNISSTDTKTTGDGGGSSSSSSSPTIAAPQVCIFIHLMIMTK